MGKTRRAITPADGVEVRRRVAWATELPEVDISIVFIGLVANGIRYIGSGKPRGLTAQEVASVAHAGIFPGRDGWEIEVRRELPAPWAWWTSRTEELTFQYLSQTDTLRGCIAQAWPDEALIYRVPGAHGILAKWPAESIDSARERAEDECWSRGLFGVVEDAPAKPDAAPPVDRAQAIRDALLVRLPSATDVSRGVPLVDLLLCVLGSCSWPDPKPAMPEVRAALASIGAVAEGDRWRLSDGPPPGWEWRDGTIRKGSRILARAGMDVCAASIIVDGDSIQWRAEIGTAFHASTSIAEAEAAALMACRRAGLFGAVERADEEPAFPADAGIERGTSTSPKDAAALGIYRIACHLIGIDETGFPLDPNRPGAGRLARLGRLCEAFVTDLRASLTVPPMPSPRGFMSREDMGETLIPSAVAKMAAAKILDEIAKRPERDRMFAAESEAAKLREQLDTAEKIAAGLADEVCAVRELLARANEKAARTTDGALTAYLLEHHRDEWRPGDDALALTIRLLDAARMRERLADGTAAVHASKMREVEEEREAFAAEARAAGALAATREQERDALANTAATLRRERDEAQADLAKMRDDVLRAHRDLAAKMGAPRG